MKWYEGATDSQRAPYGTERSYNGLRLAKALGTEGANVTVFLLADAVTCANRGQKSLSTVL